MKQCQKLSPARLLGSLRCAGFTQLSPRGQGKGGAEIAKFSFSVCDNPKNAPGSGGCCKICSLFSPQISIKVFVVVLLQHFLSGALVAGEERGQL